MQTMSEGNTCASQPNSDALLSILSGGITKQAFMSQSCLWYSMLSKDWTRRK